VTEGLKTRYALRFLNNDTGAEIVANVPHLHATTWQDRAYVPGQPSSSLIGSGKITLPAPGTDEFRNHADDFRAITIGQRVEGYLGDRVGRTPIFSGIVVPPLDRRANAPWEINFVNSIYMLQQSQLLPGEAITLGSYAGYGISRQLYGTQEVLWGDDFANWPGTSAPGAPAASDYNNTNWTWTAADPYFGLPALVSGTQVFPTDAHLTTATTWGTGSGSIDAPWGQAIISVQGVMIAGSGSVAGNIGVWLIADSTTQNGLLVDAYMQPEALAGWYSVGLRITDRTSGTFTQLASALIQHFTSPLEFRLDAIFLVAPDDPAVSSPGIGSVLVKAIFNGQDPGVQADYGLRQGPGRIGLRTSVNAGGSPNTYVNQLQFTSRTSGGIVGGSWGTNRFGDAQFVNGGQIITAPITAQGQSHLDVISVGATWQGAYLRVDPGAGHKSDKINFGGDGTHISSTNPGNDLTGVIQLIEGVNIELSDSRVATVPEIYGTGVKLNSLVSPESGGSVVWTAPGKPGDAVVLGTTSEMAIPGFTLLSRYASRIRDRRLDPLVAVAVRVIRDQKWCSVNDGAGPRVCDMVLVHMPTLGVNWQSLVIAGIDHEEDQATALVYFSALPWDIVKDSTRVRGPLEFLTNTYQPR